MPSAEKLSCSCSGSVILCLLMPWLCFKALLVLFLEMMKPKSDQMKTVEQHLKFLGNMKSSSFSLPLIFLCGAAQFCVLCIYNYWETTFAFGKQLRVSVSNGIGFPRDVLPKVLLVFNWNLLKKVRSILKAFPPHLQSGELVASC